MNQDNRSGLFSHASVAQNWRQLRNNILKSAVLVVFLIFFILHCADPIRLVTADLGRHLKNGELILAGENKVFTSNFYSYTAPDHPFVNHHWGAGVLFFWLYQLSGFTGLSFFYMFLLLGCFLVYFLLARRLSSFSFAFFFSVLALPLMSDRLEIRPEGISTLLTGIFLYLLMMYKYNKASFKVLAWAVVLMQIIWVNTHILFFIGGFLVLAFFLDAWLGEGNKEKTRNLFILGLMLAAACVVNPAGIKGALVPLTIFKEYGYRLAENQTVFFMQKRFGHDPKYLHFEVMAVISLIGLAFQVIRRGWRASIGETLVVLFFMALGFKTVRSMASFAFVFVPLGAMMYYEAAGFFSEMVRRRMGLGLLAIALAAVVHGVVFPKSYFSPCERLGPFVLMNGGAPKDINVMYLLTHPKVYSGLVPGISSSADFFKANNIQGPMFNNYDIGGYLIFYLFPQAKVFVDNRPEVYSVSFFKDMYVPMQEREDLWKEMDAKYNFNVIYFYRHDLTPWAQNFLVSRVEDPLWAPVFVDDFTIIFLKRNPQNQAVIARYGLPRSMFGVTR